MLPRNMPHPLDNESSRQYPDNLPLHAAEQKPHIFNHNYRQQVRTPVGIGLTANGR